MFNQRLLWAPNTAISKPDWDALLKIQNYVFRDAAVAKEVLRTQDFDEWQKAKTKSTHFCTLSSILVCSIYSDCMVIACNYYSNGNWDHYWLLAPVGDSTTLEKAIRNGFNFGEKGIPLRFDVRKEYRLVDIDFTNNQFGLLRQRVHQIQRARSVSYLLEGAAAIDAGIPKRVGIFNQALKEVALNKSDELVLNDLSPRLLHWINS